MARDSIDDLEALLAVAREGSFTRAAVRLGVSQSALSQTVRAFETRIGLRLLTRTTRSVAPTEAGQRLLDSVGPQLESIREALAGLSDLRDTPTGTVRITADEHCAEAVLWPALAPTLNRYPEIRLEIFVDNGFTDIVAERYDAGIRLGDVIDKDMVSVPISGDQRMIVVASPAYLETSSNLETPQDLVAHRCINFRLPTRGGLYAWEFEKDGQELKVRVDGQLVFNRLALVVEAARAGYGLACLPDAVARPDIEAGRLRIVLGDWSPAYPGYRLYYPSRRQPSAAFSVVLDALRRTT